MAIVSKHATYFIFNIVNKVELSDNCLACTTTWKYSHPMDYSCRPIWYITYCADKYNYV